MGIFRLNIATEAQTTLNKAMNIQKFLYFKETGLINNNFIYQQNIYYPRGLDYDGDYISIKYISSYEKYIKIHILKN